MIVVTGATGNVGRTLVPLLAEAGGEVVAVSRRPRPEGLPDGVRHARADVGDSAAMRPVLEGADAFFVLLGGDLNVSGESPAALLDAAVDAGVKRVVLLSSQSVATRPQSLSHARLRAFEDAVRAAGVGHTVLRPGGFASNAFAWAGTVRTERTVYAPFGDVALPVVDPSDIAAVAAAALLEEGHAGRVYTLTGPRAVSPREQAAALGEALGEEVRFVELSRDQAHAHMARFMPEDAVTGTLDILGAPVAGEQEVRPDVETVLGRPARPFAEWAARNVEAFR